MKKTIITLFSASILAGSLFAHGGVDHTGDHMHNGKMTNHNNKNGMTDAQMKKMMKNNKMNMDDMKMKGMNMNGMKMGANSK